MRRQPLALQATDDTQEEFDLYWRKFNTTLLRDDEYGRYLGQYNKRKKLEEDHSNKHVWTLEGSPSGVDRAVSGVKRNTFGEIGNLFRQSFG